MSVDGRPLPPRRRSGLFAKYVGGMIAVVTLVLVVNGAIDVWFSYQNTRAALERIQQEKAAAAAQRVEQFVAEIERQVGWTTHAQWAAGPVDQRRFDFIRLLRQVPAITELVQVDGYGREQLKVSRLAMDVVGSEADWRDDPRFKEIQDKKVWFSPVYLRKESEPYMSVSLARTGRRSGATVAEVNLKLIWDVVNAIKVGKAGYAYVVDRDGKLIAHPDISLVLRATDMSRLEHVRAMLAPAPGGGAGAPPAAVGANLAGISVLSTAASIPALGWHVFVELPMQEALQPLYTSLIQTGVLLLLGLALAAGAAWVLARRMMVPIRALGAGAERLGSGDLAHRIEVRSGDEIETLAGGFNRMAQQLQESYAGLEQKVEARTQELSEALEYQMATGDVLKVISSSAFNLVPVLQTVAETAATLCHADEAAIFLRHGDAYRWAASIHINSAYINAVRNLPFMPGRDSLIGRTALEGKVVQIEDALADPEYGRKDLAQLGGVRTLLGVPLVRDGAMAGVMVLTRRHVEAFTDKQIEVLQVFADQAVIAVENVRLITEIQDKSHQLEMASQHKSQFLANMSHELRTPLNAVLGYAELLLDGIYGDLPDRARGVLERVQSNGKHLLGLINDVLDLSKIEAGQLKLSLDAYALSGVVQTVVAATESLANAKGLKLKATVSEGLPTGIGDERRLAQVLLNLVGNAIKFTDQGSVEIAARAQDGNFDIAVTDTGLGIAPEDQARIFEEFQQVDNTSTRKKGGTGLGLAISRRIVALHGGALSVESEPGQGSTFRVILPVKVERQREAA